MEATQNIPNNVTEWIASLPKRAGWGNEKWGVWQPCGTTVFDGVQAWSEKGDESTSVGIMANVEEISTGFEQWETQPPIYYVYEGTCKDPIDGGYETAEEAMDAAEFLHPELF